MDHQKSRIWELDLLRGIALVFIVCFHIVFDLAEIYGLPIAYEHGIFNYIGRSGAILFIFLAGVSSNLTERNVRRALKLIFWAAVITLATYLFVPDMLIRFGILHFLGLSILTAPLVLRLNPGIIFVLGTGIILLETILGKIQPAHDWLFVFGITSDSFVSADYYPMIPWYGIYLYGSLCGKILYRDGHIESRIKREDNVLTFFGRHTLLVYIIHQPIILLFLSMIFRN